MKLLRKSLSRRKAENNLYTPLYALISDRWRRVQSCYDGNRSYLMNHRKGRAGLWLIASSPVDSSHSFPSIDLLAVMPKLLHIAVVKVSHGANALSVWFSRPALSSKVRNYLGFNASANVLTTSGFDKASEPKASVDKRCTWPVSGWFHVHGRMEKRSTCLTLFRCH